mgnify:CR=1 FL=1
MKKLGLGFIFCLLMVACAENNDEHLISLKLDEIEKKLNLNTSQESSVIDRLAKIDERLSSANLSVMVLPFQSRASRPKGSYIAKVIPSRFYRNMHEYAVLNFNNQEVRLQYDSILGGYNIELNNLNPGVYKFSGKVVNHNFNDTIIYEGSFKID